MGERIPRILVHCGHTLCTSCIQTLHHNNRVRCPICRKLVKQLESAERLPLNINILYEVVEKDPILSKTNFDFEEETSRIQEQRREKQGELEEAIKYHIADECAPKVLACSRQRSAR